MWRESRDKKRSAQVKVNKSRWRLVVAIVFLLMGSLVYKLYSVQIGQADFYTVMASSQHQIHNQLSPERGKIYFSSKGGDDVLYPLATNKEFAEVFVVPKDIENPEIIAEKLFNFFDKPEIIQEMRENEIEGSDLIIATSTKESIIAKYLKKLNKPDDPYEPLSKKVESKKLIELYSYLSAQDYNSTSSPALASPEDLDLKNGRIVYKNDTLKEFTVDGLGFNLQQYRFYPEKEIASHIVGFTTRSDDEIEGRYGLEEFFNTELFGKYGSIKSDKANKSSLMIINDREYVKPIDGSDLILTIDRNIEFVACDKLKESVERLEAEGGTVIVMNPSTGGIIAMCSYPSFDPNNFKDVEDISYYNNPAIFYQYEPGSVFKTVTMSIALDQGAVTPSTTYKDEGEIMIKGWHKPIRNADFFSNGPHGIVDMNTVLEESLNTGVIFAMNKVGPDVFAEYVKKFGFGEATGIELGAESPGNINNLLRDRVKDIDAATASFGQGVAVTPLQMIMPYQAIANQGLMMKPHVVKTILHSNGEKEDIEARALHQVVSKNTAATISAMLVNVVENGHGKKASIDGYYIGGKTGTAQVARAGGYSDDEYVHTFVGLAPIEEPAFVMLTKIDNPKGVEYSEGSAVPLWHDIAEFILNYYSVPKTR